MTSKHHDVIVYLFFTSANTQFRSSEMHKNALKADRRIKEMQFTADENRKNMERMTDMVDKLQGKIRTWVCFFIMLMPKTNGLIVCTTSVCVEDREKKFLISQSSLESKAF